MIDHCISYSTKKRENDLLNVYITDALKAITENTSKFVQGSYLDARYADLIRNEPKEEETPEGVIDRIRNGLSRISNGPI